MNHPPAPTCEVVILAAGKSTRLGTPKPLLPIAGEPLLQRIVRIARQTEGTGCSVVIGAEAARMRAELSGLSVAIIENTQWMEGMGSSIRVAVEHLAQRHPMVETIIFLTCDQPLITPELIASMVIRYQETQKGMVACAYGGTLGIPVLFHARYFPALQALTGDRGAKKIIAAHPQDVESIPFPDGELDLDTPELVAEFKLRMENKI